MIRRVLLCLALLALFVPPASASADRQYHCPQWHTLLRKHGLPVAVFDPIMWRESRCISQAVGWNYRPGKNHTNCLLSPAPTYKNCSAVSSYDIGLLQINSTHRTLTARVCKRPARQVIKSLTDPSCNLKVAAVLWADGDGAGHWRVSSGQ